MKASMLVDALILATISSPLAPERLAVPAHQVRYSIGGVVKGESFEGLGNESGRAIRASLGLVEGVDHCLDIVAVDNNRIPADEGKVRQKNC